MGRNGTSLESGVSTTYKFLIFSGSTQRKKPERTNRIDEEKDEVLQGTTGGTNSVREGETLHLGIKKLYQTGGSQRGMEACVTGKGAIKTKKKKERSRRKVLHKGYYLESGDEVDPRDKVKRCPRRDHHGRKKRTNLSPAIRSLTEYSPSHRTPKEKREST